MIAIDLNRKRVFGYGNDAAIFRNCHKMWDRYSLFQKHPFPLGFIRSSRTGRGMIQAQNGWTLERKIEKIRGASINAIWIDEAM